MNLDLAEVEAYVEPLIKLAVAYAPKVLLAILTLIFGFWLIGVLTRGLGRSLRKRNVDETLAPFLGSLAWISTEGN